MKTVLLVICIALVVIVAVLAGTLARNQARLFQPPGFFERLHVYLNQHTAESADNHVFPELRTPVFDVDTDSLFAAVLEAIDEHGWQRVDIDTGSLRANVVVTTPLMRYKDDLTVQVKRVDNVNQHQRSALVVRSSSRVGKGDLAANAGHIQRLVAAVEQRLGKALRQ